MHKSQVFFGLMVAYIAGVGIGSYWAIYEWTLLVVIGTSTAILAVSAYRRTFGMTPRGIVYRRTGFFLGALLLMLVAGVWRYNGFNAAHGVLAQFADREAGTQGVDVALRGYVDGDWRRTETRVSLPFRVKEVVVPGRTLFVDERVLVITDSEHQLRYGERGTVEGTLRSPENFSSFDYVAYLKKDGIRYTVSYPSITSIPQLTHEGWRDRLRQTLMVPIMRWRDTFVSSLQSSVPHPAAGYLAGILLGIRSDLPASLQDAFSRTGMSHVLAISGYNITVVAQAVMALFLVVLWRKQALWWTMGAIVVFVIMTGASPSVVRAALMGLLVLVAGSYGRLYSGMNAIVCAGTFMLVLNPLLLKADVGFQLSFLATLGIILLQEPITSWLERFRGISAIRTVVATTLAAQISVAPLIAYHFETFSLVSLLANVLVVPFVPLAMLTGLLTGIVGIGWVFAGKVVGTVAWAIASYQIGVVELFARIPFASMTVHVSGVGVAVLYAGIVLYCIKRYAYR